MPRNNLITISGALVAKEVRGKRYFFLVKNDEDGASWEIPKVNVRRGESSVRAAIRMTSEQAGMNARVLEEAARATGVTSVNGKSVRQKYYYYIMLFTSSGENFGFKESSWFRYDQAVRKLPLKRELKALRFANTFLRKWKTQKNRFEPEVAN